MQRYSIVTCLVAVLSAASAVAQQSDLSYPIVDTGVVEFYSDSAVIAEPGPGDRFYGQDAHYLGNAPWYTDNGDGTVTDYDSAAYIAFGETQGRMRNRLLDVHGAGAQRSDPKTAGRGRYPDFFGPQGDVRYVFNYVGCLW